MGGGGGEGGGGGRVRRERIRIEITSVSKHSSHRMPKYRLTQQSPSRR